MDTGGPCEPRWPLRAKIDLDLDRLAAVSREVEGLHGAVYGVGVAARFGFCRTGSGCQHRGPGLRLGRLDIFQRQFELLDGAVHLLAGRTEPCPFENRKLRLNLSISVSRD